MRPFILFSRFLPCLTSIFGCLIGTLSMAQETPKTDSLVFKKWTPTINIPDPVAIALDPQGRAYVTQTQRRKSQDLDIRNNRDWIPTDVGLRSVDEKQSFYRSALSPEQGASDSSRRRVKDWNQDGSHDYRDLQWKSELIHVVQDTDDDGVADQIDLFADNFQTEVTGIAAGVLEHDGYVYSTIAPDVWKLKVAKDGSLESREKLATGFGLHIAYAGHDMHGLTVGPDGKIYWSIGDKGIRVTRPDRSVAAYPNQGGVMRCNPDGSDFEVFAHGLRNVQELAFDAYGNLFGVDNDADQPGERERFVYIVPGMDAGWRCNYQYRGSDYNPWTAEGLWKLRHQEQPAYIVPPLEYAINGPAGFAFNPGTALGPDYRDTFFLTGAPAGDQVAFRVQPTGAAFKRVDLRVVGKGLPLVGINFGPDGALYAVDWGGGYPLNETGAIYQIDVAEPARDSRRPKVREVLKIGFVDRDTSWLIDQLGHSDQRVRLGCQFELVRRGAIERLQSATQNHTEQLGRIHAIWGCGQLARADYRVPEQLWSDLLADRDAQIRIQAARVVADLDSFTPVKLLELLGDDDLHVQFHAAIALASHAQPSCQTDIVKWISGHQNRDAYLRHAGVMALAATEGLSELHDHPSPAVRRAAVVALRIQRNPTVAAFLADPDLGIANEAALAIHDDDSIPEALPDLAKSLESKQTMPASFLRRCINANLRLGRPEDAERLLDFIESPSAPLELRQEALECLSFFRTPPDLDRVDGRNRHQSPRIFQPSESVRQRLSAVIRNLEPELASVALRAMRRLELQHESSDLSALALNTKALPAIRIEALQLLKAQEFDRLDSVAAQLTDDRNTLVAVTALKLLAQSSPEIAAARIASHLEGSASTTAWNLRQKQNAVSLLPNLGEQGEALLLKRIEEWQQDRLPAGLQLEVLDAAEQLAESQSEYAEPLEAIRQKLEQQMPDDPASRFSYCLTGGDSNRGKRLFATHVSASCARCHRVGDQGSAVGPDLTKIAQKRSPEHLLRSIVAPSKEIEPNYRSHFVQTITGDSIQGLLKEETDAELILVDQKGEEIRIPQEDIEEAAVQQISIMPEMLEVLEARDIRDLVAYLKTLK